MHGLRDAPAPFAFYMSSEAHSCARKAIELWGWQRRDPDDRDRRRLPHEVDALEAALEDDRVRHVRPIAVIATGGTTNTGAIDDLSAIADVCRRHDVWLTWTRPTAGPRSSRRSTAGPSRDRTGRQRRARSAQMAVRAGGSGLVLVRDADAMRSAFSLVPPYCALTATPPASAARPGSSSTASSRRAASAH